MLCSQDDSGRSGFLCKTSVNLHIYNFLYYGKKTKERELLPAETEIGQLYAPKEVPQLLTVTLRTVQARIWTGKLRATQYGRVWRMRAANGKALGREKRKMELLRLPWGDLPQ